jgi:hypothetical protein
MSTDSIVIIATIIIGFIGVFVMLSQINTRFDTMNARIDAVNAKIDSSISELRTEFKADLNTLEIKLNTLLMGLFRDYYRPVYPPKEDEAA